MNVTITTAIELSAAQLATIKTAVTRKYGKTVTFHTVVDTAVVGGVQIALDSRFLDGSVQGKLAQLRKQLLHSEA